jgi:hypothetical protein
MGYLTYPDFMIAELSYYIENIFGENYQTFKFVEETRKHFEELPEIKKYYEQESSLKVPFVPPQMAVIKF